MMLQNFKCENQVVTVEAHLVLTLSKMELSFEILGAIDAYIFDSIQSSKCTDELWRRSCFELFIALPDSREYWELNIASSGAWNLYHLEDYRSGVTEVFLKSEPEICIDPTPNRYRLSAVLDITELLLTPSVAVNVAAILLTQNQERTFWAVNHPLPQPDFHAREGFFGMDINR